jgi:glycosyltransferase involved in cell wall biosynthesis
LKVVHFGKYYPPYQGGMETFLATLCKGLINEGLKCEVLVSNDGMNGYQHSDDGVLVRRMRTFGTFKSQPICPEGFVALRGVRADIIHLHHPNPLAEFGYFLCQPKGRLVVTYHSDIVNQVWLSKMYAPVLSYILDKADAIIATSWDYVASSPILPKYQKKIRVIHLACKVTADGGPKKNILERESRPEPQYLFVGRLVPYKGLPVLFEALQHVPGILWIVGTGPREEMLKNQVAELSLNRRVEFLGNISDQEKFQRLVSCDALILPSINRAEAFGIVLLEAMAMGRPVVVSDLPTGVRVVVKHGVNGLRFPTGDARALAATLKRLIDNPEEARRMGEAGREMVKNYSVGQMVKNYVQLYSELCNGG